MGSAWWSFALCSVVSCLMLQSVDMKSGRCCFQTPLEVLALHPIVTFEIISVDLRRGSLFFAIDATLEGSSMGYLSLPHSPAPRALPRVIRVSDVKASKESHAVVSRRKRNILFPSGVKLCAQETTQQVVANHLSYFNLRGKTGRQPPRQPLWIHAAGWHGSVWRWMV